MAVRTAQRFDLTDGVILFLWEGLLNTDTGQPVEAVGHADRTAQIVGTFSVGGTCVIEGSLDGTTYATLTDPQGNAISKTAAAIEMVAELTRYIRPNITAGDGSTDIDVYCLVRRAQRP